jgi:hypothetical protein
LSGAIAAGLVVSVGNDATLLTFYCAPGLAFGIVIGGALAQGGLLRGVRLPLYLAASGLSNAAAVFFAIEIFEDVSHVFDSEILTLGLIGLGAGALGAALLTFAGRMLMPVAGVLAPIAAGTLCGALLPVLIDVEVVGAFIFYIVWQAAYAAAIGRTLPPKG